MGVTSLHGSQTALQPNPTHTAVWDPQTTAPPDSQEGWDVTIQRCPAPRPTAGARKGRGKTTTKDENKRTSSPDHGKEERTPLSQGWSFLSPSFWPGLQLPAAPFAGCLAQPAFMASWGTPWIAGSYFLPRCPLFRSVSLLEERQ